MAITYDEALSTLTSMFGPPWSSETLDAVLRHHDGHMENTVETVLGWDCERQGDPEELVRRLKDPAAAADNDSAVNNNNSGASTPVTSNGTGGSGTNNTASTRNGRRLRGIKTDLPDDFLRIPGVEAPPGTELADVDADEQLARMLQDELFAEELRNNPEFAHLAGGRGAGAGGGGWSGASGGFPGARRTTAGGIGATSGAAATANAQPPLGPAVIDRLGELGENAKRRLTLFARNFNDRMHERAVQGGGGIGGGPGMGVGGGAASAVGSTGAERRGLLDLELGEDEDDGEEIGRASCRER